VLADRLENRTCSCGHKEHRLAADRSLRGVSDAAQRLLALLQVADMLTEKPKLTELDMIALDVLLDAGREHASEIIRRIGQLADEAGDAEAPARQ